MTKNKVAALTPVGRSILYFERKLTFFITGYSMVQLVQVLPCVENMTTANKLKSN